MRNGIAALFSKRKRRQGASDEKPLIDFPNVSTKSDFIRAYKFQLFLIMADIRRYVDVHGFDQEKFDLIYSDRLADLYMSISTAPWSDLLSKDIMMALAYLYHKEMRELSRDFGQPVKDYEEVAGEYDKMASLLDV